MRKKRIVLLLALSFMLTIFAGISSAFAETTDWKITEHKSYGSVEEIPDGVVLKAGTGEASWATKEKNILSNGISFRLKADRQTSYTHDFFKLYLRNDGAESQGLDIRFGSNVLLVAGGTFSPVQVQEGTNQTEMCFLDTIEREIKVISDPQANSLEIYLGTEIILRAVFSEANFANYVGDSRGYIFAVSKKEDTPSMTATVSDIVVADFTLGDAEEEIVENENVTFTSAADATQYAEGAGSTVTGGATKILGVDGITTSEVSDSILEFTYKRVSEQNAAASDKVVFGTVVDGKEGFRLVILWNKIQLYKQGEVNPVVEKPFSGSIGGILAVVPSVNIKLTFNNTAQTVHVEGSFEGKTPTTVDFVANFAQDYSTNCGNSRQYGFAVVSAGNFQILFSDIVVSERMSVREWTVSNEMNCEFENTTSKTNSAQSLENGKFLLTAYNNLDTPKLYSESTNYSDEKISFDFNAERLFFNGYDYLSFLFRAKDPTGNYNTADCYVVRIEPTLTRLMQKNGQGNAVEIKNVNTSLLDGAAHKAEIYLNEEKKTVYVCIDGEKILEHTFTENEWLEEGGYSFEASGTVAQISAITLGKADVFPEDFDMTVFDRPEKAGTKVDFAVQNNGDGVAMEQDGVINITGDTSGTGSAFYHSSDASYQDDWYSFKFRCMSEPIDTNATKLIFYTRAQSMTSAVWAKSTGVYLVLSQTVMQLIITNNNSYNDQDCQIYGMIVKPLTKNQLLDGQIHTVTMRYLDEDGKLFVKVDDIILEYETSSVEKGDAVNYSYSAKGGISFVSYGGQFEITDFEAVDSHSIVQQGDEFPPNTVQVSGNPDHPFATTEENGCGASIVNGRVQIFSFVLGLSVILVVVRRRRQGGKN